MPTDASFPAPADLPQLSVDPDTLDSLASRLDNLAYAFCDALTCLPARGRSFFDDTTSKLHNCFGNKGAKDQVFDRCIQAARDALETFDVFQRSIHGSAYSLRVIASRYRFVEEAATHQFHYQWAGRTELHNVIRHDFTNAIGSDFAPMRPDRDSCYWRPYGDSGPARHAQENFSAAADLLEQLNTDIFAVSDQLGTQWHGTAADAAQIHFAHTRTQIARVVHECRTVAHVFGRFADKIDDANENFVECVAVALAAAAVMIAAGPGVIAAAGGASSAGLTLAFVTLDEFLTLFAFNFGASMLQTSLVHINEGDALGISLNDVVSNANNALLTSIMAKAPLPDLTPPLIGWESTLNAFNFPTTLSSLRDVGGQVFQNAANTYVANEIANVSVGASHMPTIDQVLVVGSSGWASPHRPNLFAVEAQQIDLPIAPQVLENAMK